MSEVRNTTLIAYRNVNDPLAFMCQLGTAIAKSRMFGCENEAQGQVLAMACLCEQINPIEITRRYHIFDGKLSMRADAMLAELRNRGGNHIVVERTAEAAEIEIEFREHKYRERLTWEDAKQESWPYQRDGETLKKNWRTPRARRQMLWARVCSESVRTVCPEIVAGIYTPEETSDFSEHVQDNVKQLTATEVMAATAAMADDPAKAIEAEFVPAEEKTTELQDNECAPAQRAEMQKLFDILEATDEQIENALAKRGVKSFRELTEIQAIEIIGILIDKVNTRTESLADKSDQPEDTTSESDSGPISQDLIDNIKSLLRGQPKLVEQVSMHLKSNGIPKLKYLKHNDGRVLLSALETNNIDLFFGQKLIPNIMDDIPF